MPEASGVNENYPAKLGNKAVDIAVVGQSGGATGQLFYQIDGAPRDICTFSSKPI